MHKIKILKYDRTERTVTINLDSRKRRLYHIKNNFYYFKYKGEKVYVIESEHFDSLESFKYIKPYMKIRGWEDYGLALKTLATEYREYEAETTKTPAAPDTSKFISMQHGFIKVERKYRSSGSEYDFSKYFPYAMVIGTNTLNNLPEEF